MLERSFLKLMFFFACTFSYVTIEIGRYIFLEPVPRSIRFLSIPLHAFLVERI